jgi:SAM-dependent methyltransferase
MTELKSFDRVASIYDETRGMPPDVTAAVADAMRAELAELGPTPRLIEVGVGTGRMAVPLAERGVRVTGIDISPAMLAVLRAKRADIDVMFAEAAHPPLRDAAFDASLFVHILHLVPDIHATVRATRALIQKSGRMLLSGDYFVPAPFHDDLQSIFHASVLEAAGVQLPAFQSRDDRINDVFDQGVTEAGGMVRRVDIAMYEAVNTARREYERLASLNFSASWAIPPERLPDVLAVYRPRIEEYFGGWEREVAYDRVVRLAIGELP